MRRVILALVAVLLLSTMSAADLGGGKFGDGASTGTTAVKVSTIVGSTVTVSQPFAGLMIQAGSSNSGTVYYGPSNVSTTGANAYGYVTAGTAVSIPPCNVNLSTLYIIGSNAADVAYVTVATVTTSNP